MTATGYLKRNTAVDDLRYEKCHQIYFGVLENLSFEKMTRRVEQCGCMPGHREPRLYLRVPAALLCFIGDSPWLTKATVGKQAVTPSLWRGWSYDTTWGFAPCCSCIPRFPGNLHYLRESFSERAGGWMPLSGGGCRLMRGAWRVEFGGWNLLHTSHPIQRLLWASGFVGKGGRSPTHLRLSWCCSAPDPGGSGERQKRSCGSQTSWKDRSLMGKDWQDKMRLLRTVILGLATATMLR